MATQISLAARQIRIKQWAEQIRDCQNRPKGMNIETWCSQNNITKANYYYRLRRVREACLHQIGANASAFVELPSPDKDTPIPSSGIRHPEIPQDTELVIKLQNNRGLSAEVFSNISAEMLRHLVEVFSHAQ